jgi:non-heme chloroperoxidase
MTAVAYPASLDATKTHMIRGGGGLRLHVREWGRPDGQPILFVHGWSQSHLCWAKQYGSHLAGEFRLVAYDLRGHGMSEAPPGPEHYAHGQLWADDVRAIVDQLGLDRVVLVGWSYGGFITCDYLRAHGEDRIAAIVFVGGAVKMGGAALGRLIGPGFLHHVPGATANDLPSNIRAIRDLVRAMPARPYPPDEVEEMLCSTMSVPAHIRANLVTREIDRDDVLRALRTPLLVAHGRADTVVLPAMAEHILATCPVAEPSWYENVGHTPHLEQPERFNRELAELTRRAIS